MITISLIVIGTILGCLGLSAFLAVSTAAFIKYEKFEKFMHRYIGLPILAMILGAMFYTTMAIITAWNSDSKLLLVFGLVLGSLALVAEYDFLIGIFLMRFGLRRVGDEFFVSVKTPAYWLLSKLDLLTDAKVKPTDVCNLSKKITFGSLKLLGNSVLEVILLIVIIPLAFVFGLLFAGQVPNLRAEEGKPFWTKSFVFSPILCLISGWSIGLIVISVQGGLGYDPLFWHLATYGTIIAVVICWLVTSGLYDMKIPIATPKPLVKVGASFSTAANSIIFFAGDISDTVNDVWTWFKKHACPRIRVE